MLSGKLSGKRKAGENGHYKAGDVCRILGISYSTLKAWENKGWIREGRRNPQSRFRVYGEKDLRKLKSICEERRRAKGSRLRK